MNDNLLHPIGSFVLNVAILDECKPNIKQKFRTLWDGNFRGVEHIVDGLLNGDLEIASSPANSVLARVREVLLSIVIE